MSRIFVLPAAFKLTVLVTSLASCVALAAPPPSELPQLPPPGKAPLPAPKAVAPKEVAPAKPVVVNLVPIELTVSMVDLKKQMLRTIVQKLDPKADPKVDPVLPLVLKSNERDVVRVPEIKQAEAKVPAVPEQLKQLPAPVPAAIEAPDMRPNRPRILAPRPPGVRPLIERIAERPLVVGIVDRVVENSDLAYRIELRSLDITVTGSTLTCDVSAGFHSDGKAPPPGQVQGPPAPGNVRDATIKLRVVKELVWSEKGKLELKDGASKVWIDPDAPLIGFPRLDLGRVIQLNALLELVGGVLDRELMKRMTGENLPDLALVAPQLKERVPFLAVSEITAYPLRGDGKDTLYVSLVIGFVPPDKKVGDDVKIMSKPGPAPEPKMRGKLVFDKDGKPDVKFDAMP